VRSRSLIQRDAADRDNLETSGVCASRRLLHHREPYRVVPGCLGRGAEHRPDRDVVDGLTNGGVHLSGCVSREANDALAADDPPRGVRRKIVLADMHASGACQPGDVCAIVHDQLHVGAQPHDRCGCVEQPFTARSLGSQLEKCRAAVKTSSGQIEHRPTGLRGRIGVDDCIE
jgi:hypothetical protein